VISFCGVMNNEFFHDLSRPEEGVGAEVGIVTEELEM